MFASADNDLGDFPAMYMHNCHSDKGAVRESSLFGMYKKPDTWAYPTLSDFRS